MNNLDARSEETQNISSGGEIQNAFRQCNYTTEFSNLKIKKETSTLSLLEQDKIKSLSGKQHS